MPPPQKKSVILGIQEYLINYRLAGYFVVTSLSMQPFSWGRAQSIEVPPDDDTYAKAALGDGYFGGVEARCFCHDIFVTKCLKPSFCWDASCFLALVFFLRELFCWYMKLVLCMRCVGCLLLWFFSKNNEGISPQRPKLTLPETNIAPENGPLEKEIPIGNHHFQVRC